MSIADELQAALTDAMRSKDRTTLDALRGARAEIQKAKTAPDFDGDDGDDFHRRVISSYVKSLSKSLETYEELGERGAEHASKLRAEIDCLSRWLPRKLDAEATAALVDEAVQRLGNDPKLSGRIIGEVMKGHRDDVDAAVVRVLVEERLARQ